MLLLSGTGRQIYTTLCANLLSVSYGTSLGWASSGLPFLQSNETVLPTGPLSKNDSSWIQSTFTIGGLLGTLLYGWVADIIGRKRSLITIALPQLVSWILIIFARNSLYILLSRFFAGVSGGALYIIIPLFVSEISDDSIRGTLGSAFVFATGIGILFAYTCGTFYAFDSLPYIYIPISALFLIGTLLHPESPHFLIMKNRNDEARHSLQFYRGVDSSATNEQFKTEFESVRSLISDRMSVGTKVQLEDFLTKPAKKVLLIGVFLMFLEQFSGVFALLFFVSTIFEYSGSTMSPNASSIIVGVIQLLGAYCSTQFVDKVGRTYLIALSAFGIASGMLVFALYNFLNNSEHDLSHFKWVPLVSFSFVLWIANLGVLTLPFLVMSELMITLPHIRSYIYSFCLALSWIFAFVILKYLESMIQLMGISGVMLIFSINALIGGIFVVLFVPETKERSFPEILQMLEK